MNMTKKNAYYQLCYSDEKINESCEKLLECQINLNLTNNLKYIFEWEYIVRRRAFSDRKLKNYFTIFKSCKDVSCLGFCENNKFPVSDIINDCHKRDIPSKKLSVSCCDITKRRLLSYKNCQPSEISLNHKFSHQINSKSSNLQPESLGNIFCLSKKYNSTNLPRSINKSHDFGSSNILLDFEKSHQYEVLGNNKFYNMNSNQSTIPSIQSTMLNSLSTKPVKCRRFNPSFLKSNKRSEKKYKTKYIHSHYGLHKSRSSPQLQHLKSTDSSSKILGLEQPSPFVKTIYQYIDEDVFMLEDASTDSVQVYSSGLMRLFQEIKPKLKCRHVKAPLQRTIVCDGNENQVFYSGRRVSESSASIISTLASISQSIKPPLNHKNDFFILTQLHKLTIKNDNKQCISNRLSDWFEILEGNLKAGKDCIKPFISNETLNSNDKNQTFFKKKIKLNKLKHAALFVKYLPHNKYAKINIDCNSNFNFQKSNSFKLQKSCVDKSSLPKNNSEISTMFLKHRLSLPQPISKYAELFKNKQNKINKCGEKMSTGSFDYLDKMKSDYNENLDVFNNNINSLSQSLKSDVDSFTAKDLFSLSEQKKNSDERICLQLDKKIVKKHDLIDLGLLNPNSMKENIKTDTELSKDDLEIKRSRKGSFIGKIKKKYMGSRSCDIEYFKGDLDKNACHSDESASKIGIRHYSDIIIEEESRTSPKLSGNWRWKKEKVNKTTSPEFPKESKFSTILSVFEQDSLSTDSKITKNVKSTTNFKLKTSDKKSSVIESKKKVLSNSPKKSSVPSFLTTFSPLRARKNSSNVILQKSAEELDSKNFVKEKELKELRIQQNQNISEIDEAKPRSVSANGYYKPHKHVMFAEESENVNFASQTSSTFQTNELFLKKCVSSPSLLSKTNFLFEQQQGLNCIDCKISCSNPTKDPKVELLTNNTIKKGSQDVLCENSTNNKVLNHKCIATNANISRCMCQESKLSSEPNFSKGQDICSSVNSRNIFGEVAKKYEGSPITKERIKHLEQSLMPLFQQHSVVEENKYLNLSPSKIAMIIPFMRDMSKTDDEGVSRKNHFLKRSNTIASGEISLKRKPSVIWAKVKNMEVTLVVDCDYQRFMQLKIESFEVRRVNTHKDIEELAVDTFVKHLQLLDKDALDLCSQDIKHLQLHSHEIPIGSVFDIASLNITEHFLPCFLHLKDKHCWSLASISYDTLIPKSFLEKYVSLVFVHNFVVFYGPSGTGKSYLARRLSHLVAHRIHENFLPIIYSNISAEKWQKIVQEISCDTSDHPKVYMLDGFTQGFFSSNIDISEILTLPQIMKSKSYIICTCTQGLTDSIPSCWQQNFRWIWLPNHEEPVDCLLQRYLRRKYIQYGNFHLQREFFRIVDWLATVWRHINSLIEKFSSSEYTIGPTMFYPCPSDILNAEEWFVDLWNYSICPYFIQTVRNGIKKYGERTNEWTDPLEMILKTYPWSCEKSKLKFIKIRMEDVGYKKNFQLSETSMTEMERLMTFLRQLELLMSESNDLFLLQ